LEVVPVELGTEMVFETLPGRPKEHTPIQEAVVIGRGHSGEATGQLAVGDRLVVADHSSAESGVFDDDRLGPSGRFDEVALRAAYLEQVEQRGGRE
jgi:hypothetical protein